MSVIFICFLTLSVVTIQWFLWGFSLSFSDKATNGFIGDLFYGGFNHVMNSIHPNAKTIPMASYAVYQMMFACFTPALAFGSIAERTRIIPWIIFLLIWCTLVYDVVSYWSWAPNGWLFQRNFQDFAGGLPVHVVSGFSGLAACLVMGKRSSAASMPHNLTHTAIGTAFLWFGWFGFNGGASGAMDMRAINAIIVTHISAAFGGLTWILYDYRLHQKMTSLGFCSGVVSGLVCITPAAGFVSPYYAPIFGVLGTLAANNACFLKGRFEYDDSLDAFAVHGTVGFVGSLLTGIFSESSVEALGRNSPAVAHGGWVSGNYFQLVVQIYGTLVGAVYAFVMTALIVYAMSKIRIPWFGGRKLSLSLRMSQEDEVTGTDFSLMGEVAYDFTHTGQKHIEAMLS